MFKHVFSSTLAQLEKAPSVSVSPRKYWKQGEINEQKKAFQEDWANNLLSIKTVFQRLTEDESLHSKLNATTRQTYDDLRSLAVLGQVSNSSVKENGKPKKCPLCPAVLKRLDARLCNKHRKVYDKEHFELLKAAEIHDQKLYNFSVTESSRKQKIVQDVSTKRVSTPCKRSFIPESSKSSYRMSDHKPNSALPLQLDDLTT